MLSKPLTFIYIFYLLIGLLLFLTKDYRTQYEIISYEITDKNISIAYVKGKEILSKTYDHHIFLTKIKNVNGKIYFTGE